MFNRGWTKFTIFAAVIGLLVFAAACSKSESNNEPEATLAPTTPPTEAAAESEPAIPVSVWVTTPDKKKLLERQEDIGFGSAEEELEIIIDIDDSVRYQRMDGFGASLTDSSAWLIANKLDEAGRDKLMRLLFDHEEGVGFSYLRLPMGASDFALEHYSYNDRPAGETDPELEHFSIDYDKPYIIPTLKQAKAINPELSIMASPWSPPGWMKTSDSLIGGSLKPEAYDPFANYFVRFIEAYREEGLEIDAITVQNEPHHVPSHYPGMRMRADEQAVFIKDYLGPLFEEKGIGTDIVIWDHNWDETYYPIAVLNDPDAKKYVAGSAFHGYAGQVENQSRVYEAHPDKAIYFTESSGGQWATNFGSNLKWDLQNLIIGATRHWAQTVLKWNLALDENHGPKLGGCDNCRGIVTINQQTGEVTLNEEYYAFGHASKFVRAGAYRVDSTSDGNGSIETVAFVNPDGSLVLLALNTAGKSQQFQARWQGRTFTFTLPYGAAATFVWNKLVN